MDGRDLHVIGGVDHAVDQVERLHAYLERHREMKISVESHAWQCEDGDAGVIVAYANDLHGLLDGLGAP